MLKPVNKHIRCTMREVQRKSYTYRCLLIHRKKLAVLVEDEAWAAGRQFAFCRHVRIQNYEDVMLAVAAEQIRSE